MQKRRTTTGHLPLNQASGQSASQKPRPIKERVTFHLLADLADKLRDIVYWTPGLTLAGLAEQAFDEAVKKYERQRGEPFPTRKSELTAGRPVRM